ncbi:MAG: VCBS repeat-containing protein [Gammaproteobacteria bacterium]|nr:VCBS repeat-containing protein [Gammaproteobacteria bacterium]
MTAHRATVLAGLALVIVPAASATDGAACPALYARDILDLPFNPAFLHVSSFPDGRGGTRDALLMSSFFNVEKDAAGEKVTRYFERDLAAWIPDIGSIGRGRFDAKRHLEVLTDRAGPPYRHVWPNESERVPSGVLPFEALVVPGGFLSTPKPGRITLVNLDDPARSEYVVVESGTGTPDCSGGVVRNDHWFYHQALWVDMDGDGRKDLVTARANLMPFRYNCPYVGELVWFRNPGAALKPEVPWNVNVLVGLPEETGGPEVNMELADLDGDGVAEIIATHFFTSDHISIFGAPAGMAWPDVAAGRGALRRQVIMTGQGRPFAVEAVDLDGDGRLDVLTSNHQGDGCFDVTNDAIPGRAIALVPPASGRIFDEPWTARVLKDNIRPNPTFPKPVRGPGRLAPNRAIPFWPKRADEGKRRPWILLGGDEASRVWILKPRSERAGDWRYDSVSIFDINDHYGPGTTQTIAEDPAGEVISTIGGVGWRYDRPGPDGRAELYLPVFEARQVHVLSFRKSLGAVRVRCPADVTIACPASP